MITHTYFSKVIIIIIYCSIAISSLDHMITHTYLSKGILYNMMSSLDHMITYTYSNIIMLVADNRDVKGIQ